MAIRVQGNTVISDARTLTNVSVSGLTSAIPIAEGGTGATSAAQAKINLGITSSAPNVSPTAPVGVDANTFWFDSSNSSLAVYYSSQWVETTPGYSNTSISTNIDGGSAVNFWNENYRIDCGGAI